MGEMRRRAAASVIALLLVGATVLPRLAGVRCLRAAHACCARATDATSDGDRPPAGPTLAPPCCERAPAIAAAEGGVPVGERHDRAAPALALLSASAPPRLATFVRGAPPLPNEARPPDRSPRFRAVLQI